MLDSYFFIPANRTDFIASIPKIGADFYIIDFEESIEEHDRQKVIEEFIEIENQLNLYARPSIPVEQGVCNLIYMEALIQKGFTKFVLPKIETKKQLEQISQIAQGLECVLLIESPLALLKIESLLEGFSFIRGVALGSHDFANTMGMQHNWENLQYARNKVLHTAKALNIKCIDVVSMALTEFTEFKEECKQAVSQGYDGKFFIHPKQLLACNSIQFYTKEQVKEAKEVMALVAQNPEFSVLKIHGRVYEKPHITRIEKIINWNKTYGNK